MKKISLGSFNKALGPLQIVHDFKFVALNVKDDYSCLDSMSETEKAEYIHSRIDRLCSRGYGGVVLNVDYNNYLTDPKAFELLRDTVKHLKEKDMRVWIYDEQYYPSGSAGGLTLAGHPEYEAICLSLVTTEHSVKGAPIRVASPHGHGPLEFAVAVPIENGKEAAGKRIDISSFRDLAGGLCWDAPNGEWKVWCFFLRSLYEHTYLPLALRAPRRYISIYNKKAVEHFADITFNQGYERFLPAPLGDSIEAVFTDEPSSFLYNPSNRSGAVFPSVSILDRPLSDVPDLAYIPWDTTVFEEYKKKYRSDITLTLPDLFDDTAESPLARRRFYLLLDEMAQNAFPKFLQERLASVGTALSGHYYGEEEFDSHPVFFGDILEHLGSMGIPGCDRLGSDVGHLRYCTACRLASSAAHLEGKKRVMIEASNMFDPDQNITLDILKNAMSMIFVQGVNTVTSYYGENILSEEEMKEFCRHTAALASILDGGDFKVDTLLYYPFEQLCENMRPQATYIPKASESDRFLINSTSALLQKNQIFFDFINKRRLLSCTHTKGAVITPQGERIKNIVFPAVRSIDSDLAEFLNTANKNGVAVWFAGTFEEISGLDFVPNFISADLHPQSELVLGTPCETLSAAKFAFPTHTLYMLVNTGDAEKFSISLPCSENEDLQLVDHITLSTSPLCAEKNGGRAYFTLELAAGECAFICIC